jgi:DNA replication protein DnaC
MAYSIEVIQRAKDRLAQAKADRESQYGRRLAEAYAQIPRLKEIDLQLRHSMALAARNVFAGGGQVREAMDKIRQENLSLQQERAALIEAHFGPGYLDEVPVCDRCGGSGYVGSAMCECLRELCRQEQKKELTFLNVGRESFDQFRLDYYPDREDPKFGVNIRTIMEKTYQTCRRYAQNFSERSNNLLFSGDTGLGKTFLSACIARTVADNGYSVMYESAGHLFANLERAKFSGDEQARKESDRYFVCDLLIVDDLGTEMPGQFTTTALYGLINDRLLAGKPTIISTNLTIEEFEKRYNRQIASRLRGSYVRVPFLGEDIRMQKNRGF